MANQYTTERGPKKLRPKPNKYERVDDSSYYFCVTNAGRIEKRPVSDPVPARAVVKFKSMHDLARRFTTEQLNALLSSTFKVKVKPSSDRFEAAQRVWVGLDICKDRDFLAEKVKVRNKSKAKRDKFGYFKDRPRRKWRPSRVYTPKARPGESEKMDFFRRRLTPYAKLLLEIIESFNKDFVTEEEILAEMKRRESEFNSKQELYRLLRYYRGPLRDRGFIMFGD